MATHLTVTTNSTAGIGTRGINASAGVEAEGGTDVFAALLGTAGQATQGANGDLNLTSLVNMSLGFGDDTPNQDQDPQAIAAVVDAIIPIQTPAEAIPALTDIVSGLADLQASLEAGQPLDAEALKRLDAALSDLATSLGLDLDAVPTLDQLTALVTDILPGDTSFEAKLTAALTPLAQTLLSGAADPAEDAGADLTALVKSIGEKLGALLASLNGDDIGPEQLAALGLDAGADVELTAAMERLVNPPVKVDASPAAAVLATPALKLTEPVLSGKAIAEVDLKATAPTDSEAEPTETADAATRSQATTAAADKPAQGDTDTRHEDRRPAEAKPVAAPAPVDKQPEVPTASQPAQAARVDAVAAPRVVQVGYQTSQQQLNLPQLAFELVRQVNDGNTRFQMRLDPPELGKIEVKLDIDASGQVNARLTVEKAETLDLMQRDQKALERALQQAGLDGAKTNLEFSLKQNPFSGGQQGQDGNSRPGFFGNDNAAEVEEATPTTVNLYRGNLSASGVNIIA